MNRAVGSCKFFPLERRTFHQDQVKPFKMLELFSGSPSKT
jgi:hypothetical protein